MCYQCPVCHNPLVLTQQQWSCVQHHQFDCAREGYVNLLPVQHKRSKTPGDSTEMMQARRAFLEAGYYQPLREKVTYCLTELLPDSSTLLDIGCGEGYYTAYIAEHLRQVKSDVAVYGLDVAKVAIRYAAKRDYSLHFCVASSQRLPFIDAAFDAVIRIYAPSHLPELQRTIKPGGYLCIVQPGPRHLYQLKAQVYQQVQLHAETETSLAGFELHELHHLAYPMLLTGSHAADLLQMTPFAWRATEEVKQELLQSEHFECETDFLIRIYQRKLD